VRVFACDAVGRFLKRVANPSGKGMKCSFCGRSQDEVGKLIVGPPGIYICGDCVKVCNGILEETAEGADSAESSEV